MKTLDGALCVGDYAIFDATDQASHKIAHAICVECPVMLACQKYALDVLHDTATSKNYGISGTWGGRLFGNRNVNRAERQGA